MTDLAVHLRGSLAGSTPQPDGVPLLDADTLPLVLLHAFPLDSRMFEPMVARLSDLPVVLIDLPGAGGSPLLEPVTIKAAGDAVAAAIRGLGATRAVVGGISMGGYVLLSLLWHQPELLAGMILMHTKAGVDQEVARSNRLAIARQVLESGSTALVEGMADAMISDGSKAENPGLVEQVRGWIREARPQGIAWAQRAMADRPDSHPILWASAVPTAIWCGSDDPFSPPSETEAMADTMHGRAHPMVFDGIGHLSPLEAPAMTARMTREAYHTMIAYGLAAPR
jgi:pimeloyl-ACP methyl ester carboxylesterase